VEAASIPDVDYSGGETLRQAKEQLDAVGAKLVVVELLPEARSALEGYGILDLVGEDAVFDTVSDLMDAYGRSNPTPPPVTPTP
jgi:SulP family sulfate permease